MSYTITMTGKNGTVIFQSGSKLATAQADAAIFEKYGFTNIAISTKAN